MPNTRGEDWHCARCGRPSGMYGHAGDGTWYCEEVNDLTLQQLARCEAFDRTLHERADELADVEPN